MSVQFIVDQSVKVESKRRKEEKMSFSLGFDEIPGNSYQSSQFDSQVSSSSVAGIASVAGDEAYSTSFAPHSSGVNSVSHDLKSMLESNKDTLKLEAMRRLVSLIARGKNESICRSLFPSVVKCVVSKNPEVKKLVYAYLVRFAEVEPDLALLSVSSFQRSLKDPNPLIRGSALRVLSSIRVQVIAPLILSAIKESSHDMSPYVRKTAALSIPKLIDLDPGLRDEAISLIETLLNDRTSHVLGSAIASFTQVCPDRLDLLHIHYRKFVTLLPDFDEWGQVILIQVLTRYARTQFLDPYKCAIEKENQTAESTENGTGKVNKKKRTQSLASAEDDEEDEDDDDESEDEESDDTLKLDYDLSMLLTSCKPLLQSRNSAVVFAVLQLHLALFVPKDQIKSHQYRDVFLPERLNHCIKPLIRLTASPSSQREIQQLVLSSVVSLTSRPDMAKFFEPHLKSFFVKSRDSIHVKLYKLQVLTNLSTSSNTALILREFQAYVNTYSSDAAESESSLFVSSVITAIGDVATRIREVAEVCLKGLVSLLSNRSNEAIVAQAVIVIRTQIMNREREDELIKQGFEESIESNASDSSPPNDSSAVITVIIKQLVNSKLMNTDPADVGMKDKRGNRAWNKARATVLWILSEFCVKNIKAYQLSPDVLRKFAQTFLRESNLVKLQVLYLATKMSIASLPQFNLPFLPATEDKASVFNRDRLVLLVNHLFNLSYYDLNYDIRDRARFLKALIGASEGDHFNVVRRILFDRQKQSMGQLETEEKEEKRVYRKKVAVGTSKFRVGTLAHFLDQPTPGYEELPPFPDTAPDPSVRAPPVETSLQKSEVTSFSHSTNGISGTTENTSVSNTPFFTPKLDIENFYSESEEDKSDDDSDEESEEESGEESEEESEEEESEEDDDDDDDDDEEDEEEADESDEESSGARDSAEQSKPKAT